jgi:hypothetical protein
MSDILSLRTQITRLEDPCTTAGKSTCGSLRLRLHSPHATVLRPARFTSAVFGSGHPLPITATNLPTPEGWTAWLAVPAPGIEPRPSDSWYMKPEARDLTRVAPKTGPGRKPAPAEIRPFFQIRPNPAPAGFGRIYSLISFCTS